jgi:HlyD family secretion protein
MRAAENESAAWLERKQQELTRREQLFTQQQLSAEQRDETRTAVTMAQAARDRVRAQREQMETGNRSEDKQIAEAAYQMAQADVARAQALLEKTRIRSPIEGTVLRRELRQGETVTTLNPLPLVRIGDMRSLVVRAEIDELDITRVKLNASATVSADAYPNQKFSGKVIYVSRRMGNRVNKTDNPADKEDVRVLEALIELSNTNALPVGLRVDVKIDAL